MSFKPTKYRSEMRILVDILRVIRKESEAGPTRILYKANLSYERLNKYLEKLKSMELIVELRGESKSYALTQKGFEFLKEFEKFEELAKAFGFII
ncbi:MAG: winged helix-turn-helix domain-containing protein [Candidatus Bathyarchaeia archaeon]